MVRKSKSSKKKKKPAGVPNRNVNGEEQEEEKEEKNQNDEACLNGPFSLLSLQPGIGSSSTTSSEMCFGFDSNSNGDDPSTSSNGGDDPSTSSSSSSELFWDSDLIQPPFRGNKGFGGGNKQKKVVACTGSVGDVIGKGYVRDSPGGGGKKHDWRRKGLYNNKAACNDEAEQFCCHMLGKDCELSMAVIRDVLSGCGYDVEKALDVLLDLSTSSGKESHGASKYSHNCQDSRDFVEFDYGGDDELTKCQLADGISDSVFGLSEMDLQQFLHASGYDYRDYYEDLVGSDNQTSPATTEPSLPQTVLESLFNVPKCSEHEPDSMNWKIVVKKMDSVGQGLSLCADSVTAIHKNTGYAKGEDYKLFRKSATEHYDAMKSCYQKATSAYSSGQRSYAAILSDQGKVHNQIAREADERASREIFVARNKGIQNMVTIDLHGQHVKQAIKLLKVHLLLFTTYVHSVQVLRVITGCGTHGVGKSKLKQSVIALVEKEGIEWSEENQGTVLIKLVGRRIFSFVEAEDESE